MVQEIWSSTTSKSFCFQSRLEEIVDTPRIFNKSWSSNGVVVWKSVQGVVQGAHESFELLLTWIGCHQKPIMSFWCHRTTRTPQSSSQSARLRADQEGAATKLTPLLCLTSKFFVLLLVLNCITFLEGKNTHKVTGTVYVIKIFSQFIMSLSFVSFQCPQARKRWTNLTFQVQFTEFSTTRFSGEVKRRNR